MKKIILLLTGLIIYARISAQQVNDPNAEKRNISSYHAIEVSDGIDLFLSEGDESVAVSASETRFRDNIKTEVKNGVLKIWYEHKSNSNINISLDWGNRKMKAYISYRNLDKLEGSAGSDITVYGSLKAGTLDLDLSGGSDFDGKIEVGDLKVGASGGSDVKISGMVKKLDLEASGGSDFKGYELAADICNLEASGESDIYITVNKELSATTSGGSDVYYKGNGTVREMKSSGSSGIKKTSH